jgi:hypothetical protein
MNNPIDKLKLSVSKTFDVQDKHVDVQLYTKGDEVGFNIRIKLDDTPLVSWDMAAPDKASGIECAVFGMYVNRCTLEPKLGKCQKCPLAR